MTDDLVFLGSRLGDSLLVQVEAHDFVRPDRPAPDAVSTAANSRPAAAEEVDELDQLLLGSANDELHRPATGAPLLTYTVCDSLLNVGPIADCTLGEPAGSKVRDTRTRDQDKGTAEGRRQGKRVPSRPSGWVAFQPPNPHPPSSALNPTPPSSAFNPALIRLQPRRATPRAVRWATSACRCWKW